MYTFLSILRSVWCIVALLTGVGVGVFFASGLPLIVAIMFGVIATTVLLTPFID